jgi:ABC-2 type transport system permease protein
MTSLVRLLRHDWRRGGVPALVVPPAVLAVGAVIVALAARTHGDHRAVAVFVVEVLLPLAAGIAAGSVVGAETALELQVSVPTRFAGTVLRRVLLVLAWTGAWSAVAASVVAGLGWWSSASELGGGMVAAQLGWAVPALALSGVAVAASAVGGGGPAAALVSAIWIGEQTQAPWFATHPWAQRLFLFPHSGSLLVPDSHGVAATAITTNRLTLAAVGVVGLVAGWLLLLHRQERLVTGTSEARRAGWPHGVRHLFDRGGAGPAADAGPARAAQTGGWWHVVAGASRCELRMQLTKRSAWISAGALALMFLVWDLFLVRTDPGQPLGSIGGNISGYALQLNIYAPVVFGCLLADRLVRDHRLGVVEVLDATPAPLGPRLAGKYLGAVGACLALHLLVWTVGMVRLLTVQPGWATVGYGLLAFALISVPAILFVGAFALGGPTVVGTPLFRVLLIAYWFWNLLPSDVVPSPSGTLLNPVGDVVRTGVFGVSGTFTSLDHETASALDVTGSLCLGLAVPVLAMVLLVVRENRRRATR